MEKNKKKNRQPTLAGSLKKSATSFLAMAPLLLGVIALVGLFQTQVTPKMLASLFRGNPFADTMLGTLIGASAAGNPVVSYVLGGELLARGISYYAVSAFILSWVTLGFIQLPAEIEIFGLRFTALRNLLAFIFTLLIAVATTQTIQVLL